MPAVDRVDAETRFLREAKCRRAAAASGRSVPVHQLGAGIGGAAVLYT